MTLTPEFRNLTSLKESYSLSLYRLQKRGKETIKLQEAKMFWILEAFRFMENIKFINPFNVFTHFSTIPCMNEIKD